MARNKIVSVELNNIKNVKHGVVSFCDINQENELKGSSITGIYGQNGTGKTTIVNCFELLKVLALRESHFGINKYSIRQTNQFDYLVTLGEEISSIIYEFLIFLNDDKYRIKYELGLVKSNSFLKISYEKVSISKITSSGEKKFSSLIYDFIHPSIRSLYDGINHRDSYSDDVKMSREEIEKRVALESQLISCVDTGRSMIFSARNIDYLLLNSDEKVSTFGRVINELGRQIAMNTFIYDKSKDALNLIGSGCVFGVYKSNEGEIHGIFQMSDAPFFVESKDLPLYVKSKEEIELFISSFVPNFKLDLTILEKKIDGDREYTKICFSRIVNGQPLPLSEESSGIRKLFSICCALVYCYGNSKCWLIVDELDSGVFENLLGQILEVLEKFGKGQIIFTAHNLSPLERINSKSIVFTTRNNSNRFIRFTNVHPSNNLRNLYLRALRLGGTKEPLTSDVDIDSIDNALYLAYKAMR